MSIKTYGDTKDQKDAIAFSSKAACDGSIAEYNPTGLTNVPMSVSQQQLADKSKTYGGKQ